MSQAKPDVVYGATSPCCAHDHRQSGRRKNSRQILNKLVKY